MALENRMNDGLCAPPAIEMRAHELLGTVCLAGGVPCPCLDPIRGREYLARLGRDPTATIRLTSPADEIPHFSRRSRQAGDPEEIWNRKRDLDVLQRLGLVPGAVRRARYLYTLLFERIPTLEGLCAWNTEHWEGCPHARSGAYESIAGNGGWTRMTAVRAEADRAAARARSARRIAAGERLFVRPHHLMCLACWFGITGGAEPRPNDTIYELLQRIRRDPEVPIVLVEGCCMVCDCCDGFHPETGRCVHDGGLIRDYKKDLDVLQRLGLLPGAELPARKLYARLFERIPSVRDICAYGDGRVRSHEWEICGSAISGEGYARAREHGILPPP